VIADIARQCRDREKTLVLNYKLLKPSTLVRYPPAKHRQRQGERQAPPQGQGHVHDQAQDDEEHPEDFLFHLPKTLPRMNTDKRGSGKRSGDRVIARDLVIGRAKAYSRIW